MKVILLQDVEKLGKKYDLKEVKDGYARNTLIPKGLVKLATEESIKWAEMQKEIIAKKAEENLKQIESVATKIDGFELTIAVKLGDKDQLFEHINSQKIVEKLKEAGFEVKKSQIELTEPIKEVGEFPIKIKFDHNLEAEVKIIVAPEQEKEKESELE